MVSNSASWMFAVTTVYLASAMDFGFVHPAIKTFNCSTIGESVPSFAMESQFISELCGEGMIIEIDTSYFGSQTEMKVDFLLTELDGSNPITISENTIQTSGAMYVIDDVNGQSMLVTIDPQAVRCGMKLLEMVVYESATEPGEYPAIRIPVTLPCRHLSGDAFTLDVDLYDSTLYNVQENQYLGDFIQNIYITNHGTEDLPPTAIHSPHLVTVHLKPSYITDNLHPDIALIVVDHFTEGIATGARNDRWGSISNEKLNFNGTTKVCGDAILMIAVDHFLHLAVPLKWEWTVHVHCDTHTSESGTIVVMNNMGKDVVLQYQESPFIPSRLFHYKYLDDSWYNIDYYSNAETVEILMAGMAIQRMLDYSLPNKTAVLSHLLTLVPYNPPMPSGEYYNEESLLTSVEVSVRDSLDAYTSYSQRYTAVQNMEHGNDIPHFMPFLKAFFLGVRKALNNSQDMETNIARVDTEITRSIFNTSKKMQTMARTMMKGIYLNTTAMVENLSYIWTLTTIRSFAETLPYDISGHAMNLLQRLIPVFMNPQNYTCPTANKMAHMFLVFKELLAFAHTDLADTVLMEEQLLPLYMLSGGRQMYTPHVTYTDGHTGSRECKLYAFGLDPRIGRPNFYWRKVGNAILRGVMDNMNTGHFQTFAVQQCTRCM